MNRRKRKMKNEKYELTDNFQRGVEMEEKKEKNYFIKKEEPVPEWFDKEIEIKVPSKEELKKMQEMLKKN
jgi:hypothetical protein